MKGRRPAAKTCWKFEILKVEVDAQYWNSGLLFTKWCDNNINKKSNRYGNKAVSKNRLSDFDDKTHPDTNLAIEMERLEVLASKTLTS